MEEKSRKWEAIFAISLVLVLVGLVAVCIYFYKMYTSGNEYDDLKKKVSSQIETYTGNPSDNDDADAPLDNVAPDTVRTNNGINFTELWKINKDLYAWIKVPNTMIDYPIAQYLGDDDTYYLQHNMYKETAFAGCIYTEKANRQDFSDPNTVLYGHNMLNGSMFRGLHEFQNKSFFDKNQYFYIYTPERTLTYEIFSAYAYDDRHLLSSFNYDDETVWKEYLDYAQKPVNSPVGYNARKVSISTEDRIVTLSTCLGNSGSLRYLVQGVLIKDEPAK